MANSKKKSRRPSKKGQLEKVRSEYRALVGQAIIEGLISADANGLRSLGLAGPDYDQDTGDYTQSGGGDHQQNGGNYTQSP